MGYTIRNGPILSASTSHAENPGISKEIHFRLSRHLEKIKEIEAFSRVEMVLLETGASEVLSYVREHGGDGAVVIQNLSDRVSKSMGQNSQQPGRDTIMWN